MSSKQTQKKRGRINVVACNKCKRDKKRCDGSYLTQKPCKYCRDRKECCEYTEPNRLRINRTQGDTEDNEIITNIDDIMNENHSNQYQDFPLQQQELVDNELHKSDLFLQLLTDPSTTNEQMIILKRLYNEITRNPENSKFIGNKRDELCMKLKLLSSSNDNNHTKIQIWDDLCSLVNELDNKISKNENNSNILDSLFENFNSWNSETLGFSSATGIISTTTQPNLSFSNDQLNVTTNNNNQQQSRVDKKSVNNNKVKKVKNIKENKKENDTKKRKTRKNQRGNKRTQPYPAGGQIVIRPSKQAHTMIWHQNDPLDDVPIMAFQLPTPPTPPPATRPPQRTQFQQPLPSFTHFQSMIPVNLWDHSTTLTMLSPKPSPKFSESEINNEPTTNSILLSPTPSLHDDIGDIASSPSNSSIDHVRVISDDEKDHFGLISLASTSTGSPQSFTVEEFIEMWSNSSDDLSVVEPIWNC